jgi:uncharacterized protein YjbI with pentapeptide repeats
MANQEHLDLLKQGVETWNKWREEHATIRPDLSEANLREADLRNANLLAANLRKANLSKADLGKADLTRATLFRADLQFAYLNEANLREANLNGANLKRADLSGADLTRVDFREAYLSGVLLIGANLSGTDLRDADLKRADLSGANLSGTDLSGANFNGANLREADFSNAILNETTIADVDLSMTKGLDYVYHRGPSTIGIDTIYLSQGNIPEFFMKRAGVPDTFLSYMHSLVGQPFDYYTCFISYSSKDSAFAERLYADLQSKGVRCWFASEDLKIGEKFWHRIDESIRLYDKLLVILSEDSVASTWVEHEVMAALEKERQQNKLVLFPIKLDATVMQTSLPWAASLRRERHIGDFTRWKDHENYQNAFSRLLRDLKAASQ